MDWMGAGGMDWAFSRKKEKAALLNEIGIIPTFFPGLASTCLWWVLERVLLV